MIPSHSRKIMSGWSNYSGMVISHKMNESEMGYRGSKSNSKEFVKEQRVDGSCFPVLGKLRCTLMGCESSYQVKIPSKQLYKYSYSTLPRLDPWFISGFTDAEGCFSISIQHNTKMKTNWRVLPSFHIKLHIKDINILEDIKYTWGIGTIRKSGLDTVFYTVESFTELEFIINHFEKYPLISAKYCDYLLFKECFEIIKQKKHLTSEGLLQLVALKSSLNWGLSDKLAVAFPNIISVQRPQYEFKGIPHPYWVSGFTSGDGSFNLRINRPDSNKDKGPAVSLRYSINLNIREEALIKGLVSYFKSFSIVHSHSKNYYVSGDKISLQFNHLSEILNIIIPFFEKYPLPQGRLAGYKD